MATELLVAIAFGAFALFTMGMGIGYAIRHWRDTP